MGYQSTQVERADGNSRVWQKRVRALHQTEPKDEAAMRFHAVCVQFAYDDEIQIYSRKYVKNTCFCMSNHEKSILVNSKSPGN